MTLNFNEIISLNNGTASTLQFFKNDFSINESGGSTPETYTQVEYLEATGTQYLIIPYLVNNKTKLYCRYKQTENGDAVGSAIFGNTSGASSTAANRGLIRLLSGTSTFNRVGWGDSTSGSIIDLEVGEYDSLNVWYEIYFDLNKIYIDNELVAISATPTTETWVANREFGIFARNGSSSPMPSKARISALWIKEDDDIIINLVPAKRDSDNVLGMLDTISNTFYTNAGTGEFLTGQEPEEVHIKQMSCNYTTSWILQTNGDLYGCGNNDNGQQGSGDTTNVLTLTKRLTNVKKVYAKGPLTWVIKNDNTLWGCGLNDKGQQGSGDTNNVLTFTQRTLS